MTLHSNLQAKVTFRHRSAYYGNSSVMPYPVSKSRIGGVGGGGGGVGCVGVGGGL